MIADTFFLMTHLKSGKHYLHAIWGAHVVAIGPLTPAEEGRLSDRRTAVEFIAGLEKPSSNDESWTAVQKWMEYKYLR